MTLIKYSYEDIENKSKNFLRDTLGQELYSKLVKDGKIEIESGNNVYELYANGRVINKNSNESYCIVTDRSDYPSNDIVAIKYAWLKYNINRVERVANKTAISSGNFSDVNYDAFVYTMKDRGWSREQISIDETDTNFASVHTVNAGHTGRIISIICPAGKMITTIGTIQEGTTGRASRIGLHITDKNGIEIPQFTRIRFEKINFCLDTIPLLQPFYEHLKVNNENFYRWDRGMVLHGHQCLRVSVISTETTITAGNIKMIMDYDVWSRRL